MKKLFGYLVLIICLAVYVVSLNQNLTDKFYAYKLKTNSWFGSDKFKYGDLYGLSYLPNFRKRYNEDDAISFPDCNGQKNIHLYMICDSYIWSFFKSEKYFCGVDTLTYIKTNNKEILNAKLDSSKMNVLVIEFSERNLRYLLADSVYASTMISATGAAATAKKIQPQSGPVKNFWSKISGCLFNKNISRNIATNTWDMAIYTPIKEWKSGINYKLFGAVDKDVKMSRDGKQLYYNPTIDTNDVMSSFKSVTDKEKNTLINRLNNIYINSKKAGFTKVYLSIIPNPVSVMAPGFDGLTYNNLVERIQDTSKLQMPYIDLEPTFKTLKDKAYSRSDSHWNTRGAEVWLGLVNKHLKATAGQ